MVSDFNFLIFPKRSSKPATLPSVIESLHWAQWERSKCKVDNSVNLDMLARSYFKWESQTPLDSIKYDLHENT